MGVNSHEDQEILINTLNCPLPSAPPENEFSPSAPFMDELECIICMDTQVIFNMYLHKITVFIKYELMSTKLSDCSICAM